MVRGWCDGHYGRWRRVGDVQAAKPLRARVAERDPVCTVEGCHKPHNARGYCIGHYYRLRTHGDVQADTPLASPNDIPPRKPSRVEPVRIEPGTLGHLYPRKRPRP